MYRRRHVPLAVCAVLALLAAACGNSPSGGPVVPTTAVPEEGQEAPTSEPGSEAAAESEAAGVEPTEPEATETASADPSVVESGDEEEEEAVVESEAVEAFVDEEPVEVDPYPQRHEFVSLPGVPGVTDDEISVAVIGTQAGNPLGTCVLDCFVTGIQSYFDYVNDSGGVYGRRLVIDEVLDDQLFQNQKHALKVIAGNTSLAAFQAALIVTGWGDLNDAGIPTFVWNIDGTQSVNRDAIFSNFVIGCPTCTSRGLPWLVSRAGGTRVASLGYGVSANSKVCAQAFGDSVDRYGPELGIAMATDFGVAGVKDDMAYGLPNGVGPEVTQMVDAGVDFIVTCMDLNAMLKLAQELERQGVRDQIKMLHPNSYNAEFVADAGSLFDGDYVLVLFAAFEYDVDSDLQDLYHEWVAAHGGPVAEQTMVGWINADLFVTGLLEAGPSFDRQTIIGSLNQVTYGADGLINPIDWSRQHGAVIEGEHDHDYELECVSYVRMEGGAFVGFQPEPWMCWPNELEGWAEPTPTDFTS